MLHTARSTSSGNVAARTTLSQKLRDDFTGSKPPSRGDIALLNRKFADRPIHYTRPPKEAAIMNTSSNLLKFTVLAGLIAGPLAAQTVTSQPAQLQALTGSGAATPELIIKAADLHDSA